MLWMTWNPLRDKKTARRKTQENQKEYQNIKPEDAGVVIRSISKTKTGAILLEVWKDGEKNKFRDAIKESLSVVID